MFLKNRYQLCFFAVLLTTLIACNIRPIFSLQTDGELARSADSFIDSLGIVIKLNRRDTAYKQYDDLIKPRLQELGISHVRDEARPNATHMQRKLQDLASIGIKSTLIMDPRWKVTPVNAVALVKKMAGAIEAVEGPNEWDLRPDLEYQGQSYPQGVKNFQRDLYKAMKKDAATKDIPVLSASFADSDNIVQSRKVNCDLGNLHVYPRGGKSPTNKMDRELIPASKSSCRSKPVFVTEAGYHNAINKYGVSEQASAKYLPRLYLEYFNQGIERTYIHQLLDLKSNPKADRPQLNYGLLRYDGSEKPAFFALKNLIAILKDISNTNNNSLDYLDYTITGNTANINHTLLQKKDGDFFLILWQDALSYNGYKKKDTIVSSQSIKLIVKTKIRKAKAYQPLYSAKSFQEFKNTKQIELQVSDHPLIVKLSSP